MDNDNINNREKTFHNAIREYIIWTLLFLLLYVISYVTLKKFRREKDNDIDYAELFDYLNNEHCIVNVTRYLPFYYAETREGREDAFVYRISLYICTFTLAVSGGAVLLLPISVIANESLHTFPNSYYLQWVNTSLIQGFWMQISVSSNICLFILMPFAYFFTESEGFSGSNSGILSRIHETVVVLILLSFVICGMTWVSNSFWSNSRNYELMYDVWNFYLPYLYSCISIIGTFIFLLCTPVGFTCMFSIVGDIVKRPRFILHTEEMLTAAHLELSSLRRHLREHSGYENALHYKPNNNDSPQRSQQATVQEINASIDDIHDSIVELKRQIRVSPIRRNVGYPLIMLLLTVLTSICILIVSKNSVLLVLGFRETLTQQNQQKMLGISSMSILGPFGAAIEITVILYQMFACIVGVYSLPYLNKLKPQLGNTSMLLMIFNCVLILVISSALPLQSRILGLTDFDLRGNYGRLDWLRNIYIVLSYNVVFTVATATCVVNKCTSKIREAVFRRLKAAIVNSLYEVNEPVDIQNIKED